MERELQVLVAKLAAHRWLPRTDEHVKRALVDELFRASLDDRLGACGMELVEHPFADNVALRLKRDMEQPVFGGADQWLSNTLELKRDQIALLVVLWAMLVLPKRQRQIERSQEEAAQRQGEMFAVDKPMPTAAELQVSVAEATLLADFGERLGGRTRIRNFGLPVLSRLGFIDRRDGRIYEGPLLDLVLDYSRMARRVLDGTLSDLFGHGGADEGASEDELDEGLDGQADAAIDADEIGHDDPDVDLPLLPR